MGEGGGVLALNRTEGSEVFFTPLVFFLSQEMSCFSWGLKRIRKFLGGLHTCKGKLLLKYFKQRMSSRKMSIQKAIHCI